VKSVCGRWSSVVGLALLALLAGCVGRKPAHNASRNATPGWTIPRDCIAAIYIEKPGAQCARLRNGFLYCKDFAVAPKDIACVKVAR
jgi:hypothetical protein